MATAPTTFTQHARNPEHDVVIGDPHLVFAPAYGSPFATWTGVVATPPSPTSRTSPV